MSDVSKLIHIAEQKKSFDPIHSLDQGFKECSSDVGNYVGYTVLSGLIQFGIGFIPVINIVAALIIGLPLQLGQAHFWHMKKSGAKPTFNNFFDPFQKVGKLFSYNVILMLCALLLIFPIIIIAAIFGITVGDKESLEALNLGNTGILSFTIILLLFTAVLVYLSVSIILAPYLIYFYDINATDALKLSFKFTKKQWSQYFKFYLLAGIVFLAGLVCFFVGVLVAIPTIRLAYYHLFAEVTGLDAPEFELDYQREI
jgi:uncharacterized membrane protein